MTHKLNLWKSKEARIMQGERQVDLCESDFSDEDAGIMRLLEKMYPISLIDNSHIIEIDSHYFVFSKRDAGRLTEQHFDTLSALADNEQLINPVYVELDEEGLSLIREKDVIRMKVPFPTISAGLAVQAHMYICGHDSAPDYGFMKCQTLKPQMLGSAKFRHYIDEPADISRNPFSRTSRIDCDKFFVTESVRYGDGLKTTSRPDVCQDLYDGFHDIYFFRIYGTARSGIWSGRAVFLIL